MCEGFVTIDKARCLRTAVVLWTFFRRALAACGTERINLIGWFL
jgi:hypothetical protein